LHGRQTHHAILASDSDDDEAEYLLGENGDGQQRNWLDLAAEPAITLDSVTIVLPDDPTRVLMLNLTLQVSTCLNFKMFSKKFLKINLFYSLIKLKIKFN
jgi:hypothetical protein